MPERIDRRKFLKSFLITSGLGIGTVSADIAFGSRIMQPHFEITSDVFSQIEKKSLELAPSLMFLGQEELHLRDSDKVIKIHPNFEIFAQNILLMAYSEGGPELTEQVFSVVRDHKLELIIRPIGLDVITKAKVEFPSLLGKGSFRILTEPSLVEDYFNELPYPTDEYLFRHELYHILQFIRDGRLWLQAQALAYVGAGCYLFYRPISGIYDLLANRFNINRREFLEFCGENLAAAGITYLISPLMKPSELQAYIQTTDKRLPIPNKAIDNPFFDSLNGKLFRFEKI